MKKTLLTLAVSTLAVSAMAATNTTTTSTKSIASEALENLSFTVATGAEAQQATNTAESYLNISGATTISDIFISAQLRSVTGDITSEDVDYTLIDPRIYVSAFSTEFDTIAGKVTISPTLRIQPHTTGDSEGKLATFRLGATASMNTTAANSVSLTAHTYETVTDSTASQADKDAGAIYAILDNTYAFNDRNSISLTYEYFAGMDQVNLNTTNSGVNNDLTLGYANSSVKNLTIAPYVSQNFGDKVSVENLQLGLDLAYRF